jgi:hypothetical protein
MLLLGFRLVSAEPAYDCYLNCRSPSSAFGRACVTMPLCGQAIGISSVQPARYAATGLSKCTQKMLGTLLSECYVLKGSCTHRVVMSEVKTEKLDRLELGGRARMKAEACFPSMYVGTKFASPYRWFYSVH